MDLGSWLIVLDGPKAGREDLSCRIGRDLFGSGPQNCTAIGFGAAEAPCKVHHDGVLRLKTIAEPVQRRKEYCGRNVALDPPIDLGPNHVEDVHAEASRLAELYSGSDALIEEVEVELVDISRSPPPPPSLPSLGWIPGAPMPRGTRDAFGTGRRRKAP